MNEQEQRATKPTVLIIGAGPAGLTAALELLKDGKFHPVILESDEQVGGISRTVCYKGNRIDIGGHRFFSKSEWVMRWWQELLPVDTESAPPGALNGVYRRRERTATSNDDSQDKDAVMLIRPRLSRIYYEGKFYDYPVKLNANTIRNLGLFRMASMGLSYLRAVWFPRAERNLEDFFVNRFGRTLYETFFESYTEKVWGVPCNKISPEWGAQRIKGLSVGKALAHFFLSPFRGRSMAHQKEAQTSLIERFFYPKFGPGQMWETAAAQVVAQGGEVRLGYRVTGMERTGNRISKVAAKHSGSGKEVVVEPDRIISTMPVRELVRGLVPPAPEQVVRVAEGLPYRDFLTVGLLVSRMRPNAQARAATANNMPPDNWIYIQDPGVRLGRLQIFNNWSPAMVADPGTVWLGLEYFCQEGDDLWAMSDEDLKAFGARELAQIGLIDASDVLDGVIIRMPKAYPAYFGTYDQFDEVREYLDGIENLHLIGRNGMHRYNNQDHSMLAAKLAVEAIRSGTTDRKAIWEVNAEEEYHEERRAG